MPYGLNFSTGPDYRKRLLNTDVLDFSALNHISAASDYSAGSQYDDGVNLTTERKRRRK
jgi:hypothetical protein